MTARRLAGPVAFTTTVALLFAMLVLATLQPHLPQFDGKAMAARLLLFPLAAAVVPVGWWLVRRRHRRRDPSARVAFPWAAATLLVLPFVIDLAGNALDLYDSIERFDDLILVVPGE